MTLPKQIKLLIIGTALFIMLSLLTNAEPKGEIIPPEKTQDSIVDYGMCLVGDSLTESFILKNTGTVVLKLGTQDPSFYKGVDPSIPGHQYDFNEFNSPVDNPQPSLIDVGKEDTLIMTYKASDTSLDYPAGKKFALLKLGLYDANIQEEPDLSQLTVFDAFLLIARKTTHYIDGYENEWFFDSVYVNPSTKVPFTWLVKNVWTDSLRIDSANFKSLSPNPEFEFSGDVLPMQIYPKNVRPWEITYNPKDLGGDSAVYSLQYKPHPKLYPDSIDYAIIKLHGIGVKQELSIEYTETTPYGDILDFGEVWVGDSIETKTVLKNTGNLKFGTVSQNILKNKKNERDSVFTLLSGIKELPYHLDTLKITDTVKIKFSPKQRGTFISRYVINSDIASRKIKGIPAEGLNQIIYLKGTGIEPEISVASDTFDFGNVVLHLDCDSTDTLNITINNNGNTTLEIQDVSIDPPFTPITPISELTIPANSHKTLQIEFNAKETDIGNHFDTLFIVSRGVRPPKDTLKIIVKASSVNPQETRLNIPINIKAKPGRLISVPIIVDKNNIEIARIFSDTLTFNPTLLRYSGYENIGTASDGAVPALLKIEPVGDSSRLSIYIEMPPNDNFEPRDTLIKLKFNTYLGDNISTSIAFANPKFSNGPCSKVLTPIDSNGIFSLDSICGLNLKAIPFTTKQFRFEDIYPNPANEKIQFEYEMAFSTDIKINVYNSYGELVEKLIDSSLPSGTYLLTYPTNNMTPGIYYFEMQAGLFRQIKKVVLNK